MEEQTGHGNPVQQMLFTLDGYGSDVSYIPNEDGRNENHINALPLYQWMYCQQTSHNYVEFLAESSTLVHMAPTIDVPEGMRIPLPVSSIHAVSGISGVQSEMLHNNSGKAFEIQPGDFSLGMDPWKERYLRPHSEGQPVNKFSTMQMNAQAHELYGDSRNVYQPPSTVTVATPGFQSRPHNTDTVSRQRANATDRRRRYRISEKLKELQELLPSSEEGSQASVLDGIIDYIKYLQLQIKDLSKSRLGGESTSDPFIFLEGYGHYLLQENMLNEPLEEIMGKLLEVNPSAAAELLDSKGLSVMPAALAEGLPEAIQMLNGSI